MATITGQCYNSIDPILQILIYQLTHESLKLIRSLPCRYSIAYTIDNSAPVNIHGWNVMFWAILVLDFLNDA